MQARQARGFDHIKHRLTLAFEAQGTAAVSEMGVVRDVVMDAAVAARHWVQNGIWQIHNQGLIHNTCIEHTFALLHHRYTEFGRVVRIERFHHLVCRIKPGFA